eukprot:m.384273 g.384273  ORF g.384273 m.384273 type:complete len:69 (-) comp20988_c0_seq3:651-857(-)
MRSWRFLNHSAEETSTKLAFFSAFFERIFTYDYTLPQIAEKTPHKYKNKAGPRVNIRHISDVSMREAL